jgi:uncharacterized protein YqjF (DUF2071 family)
MAETVAIAGPLAAPHPVEACYGSAIHCWAHNADEPGEAYRVCFECHHAYLSPADLLAAHNAVLAGMGLEAETDVERVLICPACSHNF